MIRVKNNASRLIALIVGAFLSCSVMAVSESQQAAILERIKPDGSVCVEGDDNCGGAVAAAAPASSGPKSGDEVYNSSCNACHSTGAAGAPKVGDAAAWTTRLDKGIDTVYANAINGLNGMPAKGLCMSCSDEELKAAVDYMIENSK